MCWRSFFLIDLIRVPELAVRSGSDVVSAITLSFTTWFFATLLKGVRLARVSALLLWVADSCGLDPI